MKDAYRGGVVRCPACAEIMRAEVTSSGQLEVCDVCEGMWVDWFDGELHAIAVEHEMARVERGTPLPSRPSSAPTGPTACPRCSARLTAELYRFADAKDDELITGVELLRCSECAGAFVPRGSAHLLLDRVKEGRTATPWEAIFAVLRQFLGLGGER